MKTTRAASSSPNGHAEQTSTAAPPNPTASSLADRTVKAAATRDLGIKIGAGVGAPLGLALLAALIYIHHLRKRQRKGKSKGSNIQISEPMTIQRSTSDEPHMLDTRAPSQKPYGKPELSDEARRQMIELASSARRDVEVVTTQEVHTSMHASVHLAKRE
ncbi:MAG: hypothetical protein L6R40_007522 [Gallowayella cf. fulva]|nr:MAG: hypothetical protein L6R40_007522 [Xanthomendoza cf. fulva]